MPITTFQITFYPVAGDDLNQRTDLGTFPRASSSRSKTTSSRSTGIPPAERDSGLATSGDAVPATAVQSDRRPQIGEGEPGRDLLRLPLERSYQQGNPPCTRRPSCVPPSHRHPIVARRANPAAVRLAARLKSVEDFTQFEQAGAYFDGDHVIAAKKGMNFLSRINQVDLMAEFRGGTGFPARAQAERVRQASIRARPTPGAARAGGLLRQGECGVGHAPDYTDNNLMHDLKTERFSSSR